MLEFVRDAICLSGLSGTKLKCDVLGEYYNFWWGITSGGEREGYRYNTAIVELNAATGEIYIKDTQETVLGSSGHALELKVKKSPRTDNLKVILIEENKDCYSHLQNVIRRRWSGISIEEAERVQGVKRSNVYLLNENLNNALEIIDNLRLGNAIFFFDPLRSVEWVTIEKVAGKRINNYYQTGTEFILFLFTSDWFLGRDDFSPLPNTLHEDVWTSEEKKTVIEADSLFGHQNWRSLILNDKRTTEKENILVEIYRDRLCKWFRYVLPLPFNPKPQQIFHLIFCSNFEIGIRRTKEFYVFITGNPKYKPNNRNALDNFRKLHSNIFSSLPRNTRPLQWLILWKIITQHEGGICDCQCRDFEGIGEGTTAEKIQGALDWLANEGYLEPANIKNPWNSSINQYKLNWKVVPDKLGVEPPPRLKPISPNQLIKRSSRVEVQ